MSSLVYLLPLTTVIMHATSFNQIKYLTLFIVVVWNVFLFFILILI